MKSAPKCLKNKNDELVTLQCKLWFPLNLLISMLSRQSNIAIFKAGTGGGGGYWEAFLSRLALPPT